MSKQKYQIRQAAGLYWALDMEQTGEMPCRPIPLNECGAFLFERYRTGMSTEELAGMLQAEYGIPPKQAGTDAAEFCEQMRALHVEK